MEDKHAGIYALLFIIIISLAILAFRPRASINEDVVSSPVPSFVPPASPELSAEEKRQVRIDLCFKEASEKYFRRWNFQCELLEKVDDCSLPGPTAGKIEEEYNYERELCIERYKE